MRRLSPPRWTGKGSRSSLGSWGSLGPISATSMLPGALGSPPPSPARVQHRDPDDGRPPVPDQDAVSLLAGVRGLLRALEADVEHVCLLVVVHVILPHGQLQQGGHRLQDALHRRAHGGHTRFLFAHRCTSRVKNAVMTNPSSAPTSRNTTTTCRPLRRFTAISSPSQPSATKSGASIADKTVEAWPAISSWISVMWNQRSSVRRMTVPLGERAMRSTLRACRIGEKAFRPGRGAEWRQDGGDAQGGGGEGCRNGDRRRPFSELLPLPKSASALDTPRRWCGTRRLVGSSGPSRHPGEVPVTRVHAIPPGPPRGAGHEGETRSHAARVVCEARREQPHRGFRGPPGVERAHEDGRNGGGHGKGRGAPRACGEGGGH